MCARQADGAADPPFSGTAHRRLPLFAGPSPGPPESCADSSESTPSASVRVFRRRPQAPSTVRPPAVLAAAAVVLVLWAVAGSALLAQRPARGPSAPADSARTTDRSRTLARDTVAIGQVWAGTYRAQLRQRAFYRKTETGRSAGASNASTGDGETDPASLSIGGLVINDTRTTIGSDFYDVFYSRWETPKGAGNVTVRVREQPRPNLGTRIVVEVEGRTIFRANLRPRMEQIERAAQGALARAHRYIKKHYEPRSRY